jgi:hypothetical protein
MTPWMLLAYVLVLVAVVGMAPRLVTHPLVVRLRVLFPSWRFFDALGDVPVLSVRWGPAPDQLGRWHAVALRPRRHLAMLVFNPAGNLALAHAALLQALVDVIDATDDAAGHDTAAQVERSTPYALTARLAREHVRRLAGELAATHFQFKLGLRGATEATATDVMISGTQPC